MGSIHLHSVLRAVIALASLNCLYFGVGFVRATRAMITEDRRCRVTDPLRTLLKFHGSDPLLDDINARSPTRRASHRGRGQWTVLQNYVKATLLIVLAMAGIVLILNDLFG
jgi:hypothetical protein